MLATHESVRGTEFWRYVIQTLPRGAELDADRPGFIRYDLEGSLWMVFYEMSAHVRTIQRLTTELGLNLAGVQRVLVLEDEMEKLRARVARLERQMREEIEQVHKQYRRDLVLWSQVQEEQRLPRRS